jgi:hypothetical protein
VFAGDDPTNELSAAWGVKEQLRRLPASANLERARTEKMILGGYAVAADREKPGGSGPPSRPDGSRSKHRSPTVSPIRVSKLPIPASNRSNAPAVDTEIQDTTKACILLASAARRAA